MFSSSCDGQFFFADILKVSKCIRAPELKMKLSRACFIHGFFEMPLIEETSDYTLAISLFNMGPYIRLISQCLHALEEHNIEGKKRAS